MSLGKPTRQVDEKYLDYIRGLECIVCHRRPDPHHLVARGAGGSDYTAIPLCRLHHTEAHTLGKARFGERYGLDVWQCACRCLGDYIGGEDGDR